MSFSEINGSRSRNVNKSGGSSAGFCVKTIFFLLLSIFGLLVTLVYVDYDSGQLKEAYVSQVPAEVKHVPAVGI